MYGFAFYSPLALKKIKGIFDYLGSSLRKTAYVPINKHYASRNVPSYARLNPASVFVLSLENIINAFP